jgi:hypothetical protein
MTLVPHFEEYLRDQVLGVFPVPQNAIAYREHFGAMSLKKLAKCLQMAVPAIVRNFCIVDYAAISTFHILPFFPVTKLQWKDAISHPTTFIRSFVLLR